MNKWLFGLAGLLIGGLGGFFLGRKTAKQVLKEAPAPVQEPEQEPEFTRMDIDCWDRVVEEHFAEAEHPEEEIPDDIEVPDLPFNSDEEEEEEDEPSNPFYDAPRVELISEDMYLKEYLAYGKDTLYYFGNVDELTFSDEDRIDDKVGTVGYVPDYFYDLQGNKRTECVYVRNNRIGVDFMIELKDGAPYWYESL